MDYIQYNLDEHSLIFKSPIDILHHMFCVLGNGIDSRTFSYRKNHKKYRSISAEYFENLEPECVPSWMYPYNETSRYQPFMTYSNVKNRHNVLGLQAAMKYFIKCIEMTTFDLLIERRKIEVVDYQVQDILEYSIDKKNIDVSTLSSDKLERLDELKAIILETHQSKLENNINKYISKREEVESIFNDWKNAIPLMKKQFNIE